MRIADFFPHSAFRIPHFPERWFSAHRRSVYRSAECDRNAGLPPAPSAFRTLHSTSQNRLRQRAVSMSGSRSCRQPARQYGRNYCPRKNSKPPKALVQSTRLLAFLPRMYHHFCRRRERRGIYCFAQDTQLELKLLEDILKIL